MATYGSLSDAQRRLWDELKQLRGHIDYLVLIELKDGRINRWLQMFLAVASSGSIAGWVIWNELFSVWAFIIASSQVVSAVKPYLPFEKRAAALADATSLLESLFIQWEAVWHQAAAGDLTEEEIWLQIFALKKRRLDILDSCLKNVPFPDDQELINGASRRAEEYFALLYPPEGG